MTQETEFTKEEMAARVRHMTFIMDSDRQKIADQEHELATRNETIGRLQGELKQMLTATKTSIQEYEKILLGKNERIAELEAQLSEVRAEYQKVTVWLAQSNQLQDEYKARVTEQEAEVKRLRELVYLAHDTDCTCEICVAMPHEPIICCICGQPIEGDDLVNRFWLHEKGCQFGHTGLCECDLECHAACYAGHEHEYAQFDDEDDE